MTLMVIDFNGSPTLVDFKIFNHSVEADSTYSAYFDKSVSFTEHIELPYNLNTFSFQFSSLDYRSPYKVGYEYMLEGVDDSWISTSLFIVRLSTQSFLQANICSD